MSDQATATIRIHHADLDRATLLGRGIGVNRLPVASLPSSEDVTEVTVPAGTHILQIRNGMFFSSAMRYTAVPGEVLDYEAVTSPATILETIFGSSVSLRRLARTADAVADPRAGMHVSDHVARTVFVTN